jgi:hypothetical protein
MTDHCRTASQLRYLPRMLCLLGQFPQSSQVQTFMNLHEQYVQMAHALDSRRSRADNGQTGNSVLWAHPVCKQGPVYDTQACINCTDSA